MLRFFFYGTLLDDELREAVTGRQRQALRPGRIMGWERVRVAGADYPTLRRRDGSVVEGGIAEAVAPAEAARLSWYEGEDYDPLCWPVETEGGRVEAWLFAPGPDSVAAAAGAWSLTDWQAHAKPRVLPQIRRSMRGCNGPEFAGLEREWAIRAAEQPGRISARRSSSRRGE